MTAGTIGGDVYNVPIETAVQILRGSGLSGRNHCERLDNIVIMRLLIITIYEYHVIILLNAIGCGVHVRHPEGSVENSQDRH